MDKKRQASLHLSRVWNANSLKRSRRGQVSLGPSSYAGPRGLAPGLMTGAARNLPAAGTLNRTRRVHRGGTGWSAALTVIAEAYDG